MASTTSAAIIAAADRLVTTYAAAVAPLVQCGARSVEHPPTIESALTAALHLHRARPVLDATLTDVLRGLIAAGITPQKLARLLGVRTTSLTDRLTAPAPDAPAELEPHPGMFRSKDKVSVRAASESVIGFAADLGRTYAAALRPISTVSEGAVPEAATVDAALEAVLHLHGQRSALDAALDPILAGLALGGVRRMSLAEALGVSANTLQRRLMAQPLAHARWADLVDNGDGTWTVTRAEVGRYAEIHETAAHVRVREERETVTQSGPTL